MWRASQAQLLLAAKSQGERQQGGALPRDGRHLGCTGSPRSRQTPRAALDQGRRGTMKTLQDTRTLAANPLCPTQPEVKDTRHPQCYCLHQDKGQCPAPMGKTGARAPASLSGTCHPGSAHTPCHHIYRTADLGGHSCRERLQRPGTATWSKGRPAEWSLGTRRGTKNLHEDRKAGATEDSPPPGKALQ